MIPVKLVPTVTGGDSNGVIGNTSLQNNKFLGQLRLTQAARLERMLLLAAVAHFFAMLAGAIARFWQLDRA